TSKPNLELRDDAFDDRREALAGAIGDLEHTLGRHMVDLSRDAGRHVGDRADREDAHPHVTRDEDLRHRAHDHRFGSEAAQHAHGKRDGLRVVALVVVEAAVHYRDVFALEASHDKLAGMAWRRAFLETRDLRVRDAHGLGHVVRESPEPAPEDDSDPRLSSRLGADRGYRGARVDRHLSSFKIFSRKSSTNGRACAVRANRATASARLTITRSAGLSSCSS